jgi:hypothetical protein
MRLIPSRTRLYAACAVVPMAFLLCASFAQGDEKKPQTAAQKYKNIKVLKNMPADKLGPFMHEINASLGVKCDFCHVIETTADGKHIGWEKDDKRMKDVARKMMILTNDLNAKQKILKKKANCFMCHRGRAEPDTTAPPEKQ